MTTNTPNKAEWVERFDDKISKTGFEGGLLDLEGEVNVPNLKSFIASERLAAAKEAREEFAELLKYRIESKYNLDREVEVIIDQLLTDKNNQEGKE